MAPRPRAKAAELGSAAELLRLALEAFDEHKTMVAGRYLAKLDALGQFQELFPLAGEEVLARAGKIRQLHGRVTALRASLGSEEGWEVQRDTMGIRCLYQSHPSGFVRIRMDAQVDAPLFDLLSLLREVGLWHTWAPSFGGMGLSGARQLGQTSLLNMCFHTDVRLPWPIRDRCCTFAVDGIDCMNQEDAPQQVVVLLDSGRAQDNCPRPLDELRDWTGEEVDMWDSGVIITPAEVAGTEDTLVQVIVCVDPKMSVPRWLINVAVRNFCFLVMLQVRRAVAATRLPEHLRVTTDPENSFYAFIRRRMAESLPTQLALAPPVVGSPEAAPGRAGASLGAWCGEDGGAHPGTARRGVARVAPPVGRRWAWLALLMAALAALAARYFA